ncbi:MAG: hypothetical protein AAFN10_03440, partial [Bacteroidota bacterium]
KSKYYMKAFAQFLFILCLFGFIACEEEPLEPQCDGSLQVDVVSQADSDCSQDVGQIELRAIGGDGSYQFKLDGGSFQTEASFEGVASGEHLVTVQDGMECTATVSVTLKSGVIFDDIQPIISANCATSGCHDGTTNQVDLRPAANIKSRASSIKALTEDKSMPPDTAANSLSDSQIQLIGCWVDDGAN